MLTWQEASWLEHGTLSELYQVLYRDIIVFLAHKKSFFNQENEAHLKNQLFSEKVTSTGYFLLQSSLLYGAF